MFFLQFVFPRIGARTLIRSLRTADVSPRSSPLRDVSRGGTSATQRQKFHTDDVNQCLLDKSGSHAVPNANLFNFTFSWLIVEKCCVHLRMSSSKTQMLLLEKTVFQKYWLFCQRFIAFTFDLGGLLSCVCHSLTIAKTMKILRRPISASDRIPDRFYVIRME